MGRNPADHLPLKELTFRVLVSLADGERHGWSLVQALDEPSGGTRLLPGHLYRTLNRMLDDGLIEERNRAAGQRRASGLRGAPPTRFFRLTPLGRDVARAEVRRLEALIEKSRAGKLLRGRR